MVLNQSLSWKPVLYGRLHHKNHCLPTHSSKHPQYIPSWICLGASGCVRSSWHVSPESFLPRCRWLEGSNLCLPRFWDLASSPRCQCHHSLRIAQLHVVGVHARHIHDEAISSQPQRNGKVALVIHNLSSIDGHLTLRQVWIAKQENLKIPHSFGSRKSTMPWFLGHEHIFY